MKRGRTVVVVTKNRPAGYDFGLLFGAGVKIFCNYAPKTFQTVREFKADVVAFDDADLFTPINEWIAMTNLLVKEHKICYLTGSQSLGDVFSAVK